VLHAGPLAEAVIAAIIAANQGAEVIDRGAYVRVLVPGRCKVTREAIEARVGAPFRLPGDLESIMPSFRGRFRVTDDVAEWEGA
jgi:hypothetical protein